MYLFTGKPYKDNGIWNVKYKRLCGDNPYYQLDSNLFPEVKWEDTEPTKVELTIKNMKLDKDRINIIMCALFILFTLILLIYTFATLFLPLPWYIIPILTTILAILNYVGIKTK